MSLLGALRAAGKDASLLLKTKESTEAGSPPSLIAKPISRFDADPQSVDGFTDALMKLLEIRFTNI